MNRRLFRSSDDRLLAGVAGGLADLWDVDPSLVRIVWLILVPLTGGFALIAYVVMAFVVPEEEDLPAASANVEDPAAPLSSAAQPSSAAPPQDWRSARQAARAARRAARGERFGGTGTGTVGVLIGALLVVAGVYFLVREYIPDLDLNWLWPVALIALGVVVLLSAFRRPPGSSSNTDAPG
jgi:phage shock protein C